MEYKEILKQYMDKNGYVDPGITSFLTLELMKKNISHEALTKLYRYIVVHNTNIINEERRLLEQSDSFLTDRTSVSKSEVPVGTSTNITARNFINEDELDQLFNIVNSGTDLVDFLLTRISSKSIADKLSLRLLKEKNEYIKLASISDGIDKEVCYEEASRLDEIINSIKEFYDVSDEELEHIEDTNKPVNRLIYLSNGNRCLPLEDIKSIPRESYPIIRRLLVGMEYNRFKKGKRLTDIPLSQVSDSNTVRIYFDKVDKNEFLVAGVFIKKRQNYGVAEWDYAINRSKLCKDNSALFQTDEEKSITHQKVLTLLGGPSKGGNK